MSNQAYSGSSLSFKMPQVNMDRQRKVFIGIILLLALIAFEIFNFDTTQFALQSLLGDVQFLGIMWATILAIAFCSIDFAGLMRLFTPDRSNGIHKEAWFLMGAWLLGATMNAVMTWWAVSLTLINNNFGNEVLSHEELLRYVPIFVAVLVWLTRILFIGAFSVAGVQLFENATSRTSRAGSGGSRGSNRNSRRRKAAPSRLTASPKPKPQPRSTASYQGTEFATEMSLAVPQVVEQTDPPRPAPRKRTSRVRHRPPVPNGGLRKPGSRLQARRNN